MESANSDSQKPRIVTELTARRERILRHVIQEYVALAQPVASDLIARKYEAELSPATVRNELAALEEAGLIAQPHTSAGRVPTDRGYRYFVELLMQEDRELSPPERRMLRQQAQEQAFAAVSLEGLAQLLGQPEFAQSQKLRPILEVLEQQPMLARFLAASLATPGVQVIIGAENRLEQMREASLVLTRYGSDDADAWGVVGVLGPTRLPYWRA